MNLNRSVASRTWACSLACVLAVALSGCGGSSSGGPSGSSGPTVSLLAAGPTDFNRTGGATGFDASGRPVYVMRKDSATWTVYASKDQPLYDVSIDGGAVDSQPQAMSGNYVAGHYRHPTAGQGVLVARKNADGSVTTAKYPDYTLYVADGGKAIVSKQDNFDLPPAYFLMDLATGSVTPEPLPSGDLYLQQLKGKFALCAIRGGSAAPKVYDTDTNATVNLQPAPDTDGTVESLAVNSNGQVLGFTKKGGVAQLRIWSPAGIPGEVIDTSAAAGGFFLGWLSPDASRMTYKKTTAASEKQFVRVGGVSYDITSAGSRYTSLNGLNDGGTLGFAADLSAEESAVTVAISYK